MKHNELDLAVEDISAAVTKTIDAAATLVRCAVEAWRVINDVRAGVK